MHAWRSPRFFVLLACPRLVYYVTPGFAQGAASGRETGASGRETGGSGRERARSTAHLKDRGCFKGLGHVYYTLKACLAYHPLIACVRILNMQPRFHPIFETNFTPSKLVMFNLPPFDCIAASMTLARSQQVH